MRITVKTTNFSLTEAIAVYIEEKLTPIGERLAKVEERGDGKDRLVLARVEVGRTAKHQSKGDVFRAEIHLEIPGEPNLYAEAVAEDLHTAIDEVRNEIERELKRSHEKHRDQVRQGGREFKRRMQEDASGEGV